MICEFAFPTIQGAALPEDTSDYLTTSSPDDVDDSLESDR